MDSTVIAAEIEGLYPEPSLRLVEKLHQEAADVLGRVMMHLRPVILLSLPSNVLIESSVEAWLEKKQQQLGMPVSEFARLKGDESAWESAEPGFAALREFLTANKEDEGPFVLGSKVSFADFIIVGALQSLRRIDETVYARFIEQDGVTLRLNEACAEWLRADQ
ncbi:hypothetical protein LTR85_011840 [Meristemomyces frigidus]|nr:hypothetical protein LTR85_011840 [Meristemomyces frigidus]